MQPKGIALDCELDQRTYQENKTMTFLLLRRLLLPLESSEKLVLCGRYRNRLSQSFASHPCTMAARSISAISASISLPV